MLLTPGVFRYVISLQKQIWILLIFYLVAYGSGWQSILSSYVCGSSGSHWKYQPFKYHFLIISWNFSFWLSDGNSYKELSVENVMICIIMISCLLVTGLMISLIVCLMFCLIILWPVWIIIIMICLCFSNCLSDCLLMACYSLSDVLCGRLSVDLSGRLSEGLFDGLSYGLFEGIK